MIKITYQDGSGQYDQSGNQITEWNDRYCSWVVLSEYEDAYYREEIDWWGMDNDFPSGQTMKELQELYPNANSWPIIDVRWFWTEEGYIKEFHEKPKDKSQLSYERRWEYLDYTKEKAIEFLGKYCGFNNNAERVVIKYNYKIIFDGKL